MGVVVGVSSLPLPPPPPPLHLSYSSPVEAVAESCLAVVVKPLTVVAARCGALAGAAAVAPRPPPPPGAV